MREENRSRPAGPDAWLADEVSRMALREGFSRVGLITSEYTWAKGSLRRQLIARGLHCAVPTLAERRELLYASELLDEDADAASYHLVAVARMLREREGVQRVLVACPRYEDALARAERQHRLILGVRHLTSTFQSHWLAAHARGSF
jgi:aspartate/glutamate racemase